MDPMFGVHLAPFGDVLPLFKLVMGRLIGIGIEHLQNRAFDRESESESHRKKLSLKFDSYILILL